MPGYARLVGSAAQAVAPQVEPDFHVEVRLDPSLDGPTNMARDVALLEAAERGTPGVRVYEWDGPWLSLGRFQRPSDVLAELGDLPWVMRPTGGKTVRHGEDVTVGMAAPSALLGLESRQLKEAYRALARPLISALRTCGVPAVLGEGSRWLRKEGRTADCFAYVSPNDIVDEETGLKVCGCALRLTDKAVLVQASIPVRGHLSSSAFAEALAKHLG